jgi:hypothetical protein
MPEPITVADVGDVEVESLPTTGYGGRTASRR